jgi:Protein of unknown function (DUF4232)
MDRRTGSGIGAVAAAALAAGVLSGCAAMATGPSASSTEQSTGTAASAGPAAPTAGASTAAATAAAATDGSTSGSGSGTSGSNAAPAQAQQVGNGNGGSRTVSGNNSGAAPGGLPVCAASGLAATVFVVDGSQGMGHELLNVSLININDPKCTLYGFPGFQLMGENQEDQPGADQPTTVNWDPEIAKTLITLAPAQEASTSVRIDDDVPAGGEPEAGVCEPESYYLGVTPPNNTAQVVQRINGPMATAGITVCEHGTLDVLALVPGSVGPNQG